MKRRLLLAALALALAAPNLVLAHSTLIRSEPKNGAALKHSPNEIKMWFTEPLKIGLSTFAVNDETGKKVMTGPLAADTKEPRIIHFPLPPNLAPGTYKVTWTAVAEDMHVSKGSLSFTIGQ